MHNTTQVNLRGVMLSEKSQSQRSHTSHLCHNLEGRNTVMETWLTRDRVGKGVSRKG